MSKQLPDCVCCGSAIVTKDEEKVIELGSPTVTSVVSNDGKKLCDACFSVKCDMQGNLGNRFNKIITELEELLSATNASDRQIKNVKPIIGIEVGKRWVETQIIAEKLLMNEIKQERFFTQFRQQVRVLEGRVYTLIETLGLSSGEKSAKSMAYTCIDGNMNKISGAALVAAGHLDKDEATL